MKEKKTNRKVQVTVRFWEEKESKKKWEEQNFFLMLSLKQRVKFAANGNLLSIMSVTKDEKFVFSFRFLFESNYYHCTFLLLYHNVIIYAECMNRTDNVGTEKERKDACRKLSSTIFFSFNTVIFASRGKKN